ncbi:MAG: N-acetyltransferase [Verrucomicrobia bacterium]|nr:MAG: N-acetyltransferase [Verrucomicrobiota bacterium]
MNEPNVRPARREDCPGILAIYNHAVLHTTASYDQEPRTLEHRLEWFDAHRRDDYAVFVAESGEGEVLGWSALNRYHDRFGYRFTTENSVYVAETWRGKGLGKRLLAPLIPAAEARGLHAIIAAIDAANTASVRLHAGFGFEKVGLFRQVGYKFDRWLDVVYMERLVGAAKADPGSGRRD